MSLAQKDAPKPVVKTRKIEQVENLQTHNGKVTVHTLTETFYNTSGGVIGAVTTDVSAEKSRTTRVRFNAYAPTSEDGLQDLADFFQHAAAASAALVRGKALIAKEGTLVPALPEAAE